MLLLVRKTDHAGPKITAHSDYFLLPGQNFTLGESTVRYNEKNTETENPMSANDILHAKSRTHDWKGHGPLSIKTFSNGTAYYKKDHGFFAVEEHRYLLLNAGNYAISIDSDKEIESFCLFFGDGFADRVSRDLETIPERLLDDPYKPSTASMGFFEKTYPNDPALSLQLNRLKQRYPSNKNDPFWLEEQFHGIMQTLLAVQMNTWAKVESLSALRPATREEIYRRLTIAHDYIHSFFAKPLTLSEIAQVACLSPNLLRNYKSLYGKTPHQHITEHRLRKAQSMLAANNCSITAIALQTGFGTPSSFSKKFRQQTGLSPSEFRKKVISDK